MNRKVIALVLGVMLFFLALSLGGVMYLHYLRTSGVTVVRPDVSVTGTSQPRRPMTSEEEEAVKKKFDAMFADDMDPKTQALPASAARR